MAKDEQSEKDNKDDAGRVEVPSPGESGRLLITFFIDPMTGIENFSVSVSGTVTKYALTHALQTCLFNVMMEQNRQQMAAAMAQAGQHRGVLGLDGHPLPDLRKKRF